MSIALVIAAIFEFFRFFFDIRCRDFWRFCQSQKKFQTTSPSWKGWGLARR
jgi:hypothetical protein